MGVAVPALFASSLSSSFSSSLSAQGSPAARRVTVSGIAFDSLRGVPLADGFVLLMERGRSASTDARGRFSFDTVPPGTYTLSLQHAVFDSLGLSGATARVSVTDGKTPVTLAVPSFATLWRAACGVIPVPVKDSGLVYGSVREAAKQQLVPQATVEVSWLDLVNKGTKDAPAVSQRRWRNESQADAQGSYAVCGVPLNTQLQVKATYLSNSSGSIALGGSIDRVRRRDVMIPGTAPTDSSRRGAISGVVTDATGKPVVGARAILDDVLEARTDATGRYTLRGAPTGTRQLDVTAIGMSPISTVVDVLAGDTVTVASALRRVTNLEAMKVLASGNRSRNAQGYEERRRQGFGAAMDSTEIGRRATLAAVFTGFAGLTVQTQSANGRRFNLWLQSTGTDKCLAMLLVDGVQQIDSEYLNTISPSDVAAVEVYAQRLTVPAELMRRDPGCGVVAVWTKNAFR